MENGVCKVCGIVVAVYNMEVNKSGDKTYYKQKFSISFEDKKNNTRYANLELKNQKINEFGKIIEQSNIGKTEITCWVDISDYRASSWASCNCFKIKEGNQLQDETYVKPYDDNAPIVAIKTCSEDGVAEGTDNGGLPF